MSADVALRGAQALCLAALVLLLAGFHALHSLAPRSATWQVGAPGANNASSLAKVGVAVGPTAAAPGPVASSSGANTGTGLPVTWAGEQESNLLKSESDSTSPYSAKIPAPGSAGVMDPRQASATWQPASGPSALAFEDKGNAGISGSLSNGAISIHSGGTSGAQLERASPQAGQQVSPPVVGRDALRGSLVTFGPSVQSTDFPASSNGQQHAPSVQAASKQLRWVPHQERFLLMLCFRGQISNMLRCIRRHVIAAGLLNRTLIVPPTLTTSERSPPLAYNLSMVWDLGHMRRCLGSGVVLTLDEYRQTHGVPEHLDLVKCWYGPRDTCQAQSHDVALSCPMRRVPGRGVEVVGSFLERIGLTVEASTIAAETACLPRRASVAQFLDQYNLSSKTMALGDLVLADLEAVALDAASQTLPVPPPHASPEQNQIDVSSSASAAQSQWGGDHPFVQSPSCANGLAVAPHPELLQAADSLAASLLGGQPFLCVHWRRGDFANYCSRIPSLRGHCAYAAPQAASCLAAAVGGINVSTVYLATNANEAEVDFLRRVLTSIDGPPITLTRLPIDSDVKRDLEGIAPSIVENQWELITLTLEKLICAKAALFLGSWESTFTDDIQRLRFGLGLASTRDSFLCNSLQEWSMMESKEFMALHNVKVH